MNLHNNFQKAKKRLKWAANDILCGAGLKKLLLTNKPFSRILVYHGVTSGDPLRFNSRFINNAELEAHLRYFTSHYNIATLKDFFEHSYNNAKPALCLTFDDGYYNNLKYVLPLVEKYKIPAHFFVTGITNEGYDILWPDLVDITGKYINHPVEINGEIFSADLKRNGRSLKDICKTKDFGYIKTVMAELEKYSDFKSDRELFDYWKQMTAENIREISKSQYAEIGSHGYYHTSLDKIPFSDACDEIKKSKDFLENTIQKEVNSIAYPNGDYNTELVNYAESIGFKYQLASDFLHEDDQQIRERFTMNPHISFNNQVISIEKGSY